MSPRELINRNTPTPTHAGRRQIMRCDALHAGLVPRCSFSDKQLHRHHIEAPAMPPRVSAGPMGWAERCGTLRARTYALKSSRCARRAQPRTTCSSGHSGESATGARLGAPVPPLSHWDLLARDLDASCRLIYRLRRTHAQWERFKASGIFRAEFCPNGSSCPTHAHRTGPRKAARDRAEPPGGKAHACAHLQARRARRVPFAPSARPSRSDDRVDGVHDDIVLLVLLLERLELPNGCLTALRHTAYEHVQCVSAADA